MDTMDMAGREPAGLVAASPLGWFIDPRRTHFGTTGAAGTASASVCHFWTLSTRARCCRLEVQSSGGDRLLGDQWSWAPRIACTCRPQRGVG